MKVSSKHLLALTTAVDDVTGEVKPLFALPVDVVNATDSGDSVTFDIAAPSGAKRKTQYLDEATGEVVTDADCQHGVRLGDEFKPIPDEAIEQIKEATKIKTMVALGQLPLEDAREKYGNRVTGSYFIQSPKDGSPKAYRLVCEALREVRKGKKIESPARAIVTKRTAKSRQKMALIYTDQTPDGEVFLRMDEVEFSAKVREPDAQILAPNTAVVDEAAIGMARAVIDKMPDGAVALDNEVDEAIALRTELVEQAIAGEALTPPTPVADTVAKDDLMASLEASLAA